MILKNLKKNPILVLGISTQMFDQKMCGARSPHDPRGCPTTVFDKILGMGSRLNWYSIR